MCIRDRVKEDGKLVEKVWKVDGMYSSAIEKIVYWLEQASGVAKGAQKRTIDELIGYYRSGDLSQFDTYSTVSYTHLDVYKRQT